MSQVRSKRIRYVLAAVGVLALVGAAYFGPAALRLYRVIHLYDEDRIVGNFLDMEKIFPVSTIKAGPNPSTFGRAPAELPATFTYDGTERSTAEYLDYSWSTGLLVLRGGDVVHEQYWRGHEKDNQHISWSVAKSFVSALVGIALNEGKFSSIEEPITKYLPEFVGTAYDGVRIKDILQMSSGVGFNEDYGDYDSDINRFGRVIAFGGSMAEFAASLKRARTPGTFHHYVSIDTQVLGMLVARVTGMPLTQYLEERIWRPIGMEYDAYWLLDESGMEVALGGLNVTLRDYGRFGLLYLQGGEWDGTQIVPRAWVQSSVRPDAPHLEPGEDNPGSSNSWGYGYQWWVPDPDMGDYAAAGIYNQYIYVDPKREVVIVKNSANHRYTAERQESKDLHIAMFRAIAASVAGD